MYVAFRPSHSIPRSYTYMNMKYYIYTRAQRTSISLEFNIYNRIFLSATEKDKFSIHLLYSAILSHARSIYEHHIVHQCYLHSDTIRD